MLIKSDDVNPGTLYEIREMIEKHGSDCETYLEQKFDVLILVDNQMIEVYQLPEGDL